MAVCLFFSRDGYSNVFVDRKLDIGRDHGRSHCQCGTVRLCLRGVEGRSGGEDGGSQEEGEKGSMSRAPVDVVSVLARGIVVEWLQSKGTCYRLIE